MIFIVELTLLVVKLLLLILTLTVAVIFSSHVYFFKTLKQARIRSSQSLKDLSTLRCHLIAICLMIILFVYNEVLELIAYPTVNFIFPSNQIMAEKLAYKLGLIFIAINDLILAFGQLYLFYTMSKVLSRRDLGAAVGRTSVN